MSIILASNSPRRRELLAQIGIRDFQILSPDVDETVEPGLSPARMVETLSLRKAQAAAGRAGAEDLILAADTVVALDGRVLGKPRDQEDAFAMLSALSGREHRVYTGVTVLRGGQAATEHRVFSRFSGRYIASTRISFSLGRVMATYSTRCSSARFSRRIFSSMASRARVG